MQCDARASKEWIQLKNPKKKSPNLCKCYVVCQGLRGQVLSEWYFAWGMYVVSGRCTTYGLLTCEQAKLRASPILLKVGAQTVFIGINFQEWKKVTIFSIEYIYWADERFFIKSHNPVLRIQDSITESQYRITIQEAQLSNISKFTSLDTI